MAGEGAIAGEQGQGQERVYIDVDHALSVQLGLPMSEYLPLAYLIGK